METMEVMKRIEQGLKELSLECFGYESGEYELITKYLIYSGLSEMLSFECESDLEKLVDFGYYQILDSNYMTEENYINTIYKLMRVEKMEVNQIVALSAREFGNYIEY